MKPVVVLLTVAMLGGLSACSSDDSGDVAAPTATVTATETVTESAEPSADSMIADYYGISLDDAGALLECESIEDKGTDPAYKSLGLDWHAVGLCVTDNGTHSSAVFVFSDKEQMSQAQSDSAFAAATSTGLQAPGIIIGCVDDNVCTQFKPLLEGVSHS